MYSENTLNGNLCVVSSTFTLTCTRAQTYAHHVTPYLWPPISLAPHLLFLALTESLLMLLNSLPSGAYLEEALDQPLDLSIKRSTDFRDSDGGSTSSSCSGHDDQADDVSEKSEDQRLYNLLRENSGFNGKSTLLKSAIYSLL